MPSTEQEKSISEEYLVSSAIKAIIMEIGKTLTEDHNATPKKLATEMCDTNIEKELSEQSPEMNELVNIITSGVIAEFSNPPMDDFLTLLASIENLTGIKGFVTSCVKTYAFSHAKKLGESLNIA
ncbi:MAG: hypothetical protein HN411_03870 [Waddliaceae bacterium]|jgi:hypothetical protein|nr:hypothetical protein [Waddliaceae bacterium]MBT3579216.1 hypothetical protein [Waddliaceae bacterium]MBT4444284.1 hypothetical protein [Waddliaceae bacterium]MBT6928915.1 hypothetical protein [Waddliaceae bacterium]MBT7264162.1 hypothetical protein [Waddliaceae bacterium]